MSKIENFAKASVLIDVCPSFFVVVATAVLEGVGGGVIVVVAFLL
jgi:hypothetical protein